MEDQRADATRLPRVPSPDDLQRDLLPLGLRIVQRNREPPEPEIDPGGQIGRVSASFEPSEEGQSANASAVPSTSAESHAVKAQARTTNPDGATPSARDRNPPTMPAHPPQAEHLTSRLIAPSILHPPLPTPLGW